MKETYETYYKVEEVAEILAIHKETVKRFIREGKIKGIKSGTHWRVTEDEIRRLLDLQEDHPPETGESAWND